MLIVVGLAELDSRMLFKLFDTLIQAILASVT